MADPPADAYALVALLAMAFRGLIDDLHTRLAAVGYNDLRPAHGFAFQRLAPAGATGNELAAHLDITKQAASQMIEYLEQRGYVTRQPHPSDKREKLVVLTPRGWDCIRVVEAVFANQEQRLRELLGAERLEQLRVDLHSMVLASGNEVIPYRLRPIW